MEARTFPSIYVDTGKSTIQMYVDVVHVNLISIIFLHDGINPKVPVGIVNLNGISTWNEIKEELVPMTDGFEDFVDDYLRKYYFEEVCDL